MPKNDRRPLPAARPKRVTLKDTTALPGAGERTPTRQSGVAKVSHTLKRELAERLEEFAFFQRVSESAVIEHSLNAFFAQSDDDGHLGEALRRAGAGRRRKT